MALRTFLLVWLVGFAWPVSQGAAQSPPQATSSLDLRANRLEYDDARQLLIGREGVVITYEGMMLRADEVEFHRETKDVYARGNVILIRPDGSEWRGQEVVYNLITGQGDFGSFTFRAPPFTIEARESVQESPRLIRLRGVTVTPCDQPPPREFEIYTHEATITDRRYLRGKHAVMWLGPLPVFYLPYYARDLQGENRWSLTPGYTSRLGPFLLIGYRYPLNEERTVRSLSHLNLYGERGVGLEQVLDWRHTAGIHRGEVRAFGILDQRLYRDEREREERQALLDDDPRYRLRLRHTQAMSPTDTFYADLTYLSDPWVTKDFLRREYRQQPIPDNRVVWQHVQPGYTLSLRLQGRLNHFYDAVNRLPEAQLIVPSAPLGESGWYYENETAVARLERVFPKGSAADSYEAVRADTRHEISYPERYFGFLAFVPRAAWRGTWYSKTLSEPIQQRRTVTTTSAEGLEITETEVVTSQVEEGGAFRNLIELGAETSFKAFGVLDEGENLWGHGLRHVVEPYARHTYIPEPTLTPDRLYPFDAIDRLDEAHHVRFGVRNKFQTRQAGRAVRDLVDADLNTLYRLEKKEGERDFDTVNADVRLRPSDRFRLDFDTAYEPYASEIAAFNARLTLLNAEESRWDVEYRYQTDRRNQISSDITLWPRKAWAFGTSHRYDADAGQLAEHGYWLRRRMSCVGWSLGFTHEPAIEVGERDDYRVWVRLWLLAFPEWGLDVGG